MGPNTPSTFARSLGGATFIAGTMMGGGVLAMPMITASLGWYAFLVLFLIWVTVLGTAYLAIKIQCVHQEASNLTDLSFQYFGPTGQSFAAFIILFLLFPLMAAYIEGGYSTLSMIPFLRPFPDAVVKFLFCAVFGFVLFWPTVYVDKLNRVFFLIFVFCLLLILLGVMPNFTPRLLSRTSPQMHCSTIPILFTAFGFHGSAPAIIQYVGYRPQTLYKVFFWGTFVPFFLYCFWLLMMLGTLPYKGQTGYLHLEAMGNRVQDFIPLLTQVAHSPSLMVLMNLLTLFAVVTSFLGVGLGLRELLRDLLHLPSSHKGRGQAAFYALFLSLVCVLFFQNIFLEALGFAAIALCFIAFFIPVMISLKLLQHQKITFLGGYRFLVVLSLSGLGILSLEICNLILNWMA